jgi:hypothetical protein
MMEAEQWILAVAMDPSDQTWQRRQPNQPTNAKKEIYYSIHGYHNTMTKWNLFTLGPIGDDPVRGFRFHMMHMSVIIYIKIAFLFSNCEIKHQLSNYNTMQPYKVEGSFNNTVFKDYNSVLVHLKSRQPPVWRGTCWQCHEDHTDSFHAHNIALCIVFQHPWSPTRSTS